MSDNNNCGLVDQYGRSIRTGSINTLYRTPSQSRDSVRPRPIPRAKTYEAVSAWQRREMVDVSRVIAAGVPNINTALIQAGEFSIGDSWHIKYRGTNKAWGKKRDHWFNTDYRMHGNGRSDQNDWCSTLRQMNWTRKVEADYAVWFDGLPHKDPISGKEVDPTGQYHTVKYDRISTGLIGGWHSVGVVSVGNGLDKCLELPKTWNFYATVTAFGSWPGLYIINDSASIFDGQRIIDGIIVDSNMRTLGYRLVGFDKDGLPSYADVPKAQIHFNFSARKQLDLIRGIPEIAEAIMPCMHLDDIQELMEMAVKLASALAISRESSDGNPSRSGRASYDEETTDSQGNPTHWHRAVENIFPGIVELAVNNKESLKALDFNRPSLNEEAFVQRIEMSILHTLWPRSLIYSDDTRRAGTRAIAVQANTICAYDQSCTERSARWIADRATEFAMRAGYIPYNDNLYDPYEYVFTVPGKFTVDEGTDLKMRLQALGRCIISRGIICEMDGYMAEEIEEQRIDEVDRLLTAAEKLAEKHPDFPVQQIWLMLDAGETNISFSEQDRDQVVDSETGEASAAGTVPTGNGKAEDQPAPVKPAAPAQPKK